MGGELLKKSEWHSDNFILPYRLMDWDSVPKHVCGPFMTIGVFGYDSQRLHVLCICSSADILSA